MKEIKPLLQYRIDKPFEVNVILDLFLKDTGLKFFVGSTRLTESGLVLPKVYPYILILNDMSLEDGLLDGEMEGIKLSEFSNETGTHLFEFELHRVFHATGKSKTSNYQMPAKDVFDAYIKLGQTFHSEDDYDLSVLSCIQVK